MVCVHARTCARALTRAAAAVSVEYERYDGKDHESQAHGHDDDHCGLCRNSPEGEHGLETTADTIVLNVVYAPSSFRNYYPQGFGTKPFQLHSEKNMISHFSQTSCILAACEISLVSLKHTVTVFAN